MITLYLTRPKSVWQDRLCQPVAEEGELMCHKSQA